MPPHLHLPASDAAAPSPAAASTPSASASSDDAAAAAASSTSAAAAAAAAAAAPPPAEADPAPAAVAAPAPAAPSGDDYFEAAESLTHFLDDYESSAYAPAAAAPPPRVHGPDSPPAERLGGWGQLYTRSSGLWRDSSDEEEHGQPMSSLRPDYALYLASAPPTPLHLQPQSFVYDAALHHRNLALGHQQPQQPQQQPQHGKQPRRGRVASAPVHPSASLYPEQLLLPQAAAPPQNAQLAPPPPPPPPQPRRHSYLFIDNGNVFVGAQSMPDGSMDLAVRVNVKELATLLEGDLPCAVREVAASRPSNPRICAAWSKIRYHVHNDSRTGSARQALGEHLFETLMDPRLADNPQILTLATGDGSHFPQLVEVAVQRGWAVTVWSWNRCLSEKFRKLAAEHPRQVVIRLLDEYRHRITFRAADRRGGGSVGDDGSISPPLDHMMQDMSISGGSSSSSSLMMMPPPPQGAPGTSPSLLGSNTTGSTPNLAISGGTPPLYNPGGPPTAAALMAGHNLMSSHPQRKMPGHGHGHPHHLGNGGGGGGRRHNHTMHQRHPSAPLPSMDYYALANNPVPSPPPGSAPPPPQVAHVPPTAQQQQLQQQQQQQVSPQPRANGNYYPGHHAPHPHTNGHPHAHLHHGHQHPHPHPHPHPQPHPQLSLPCYFCRFREGEIALGRCQHVNLCRECYGCASWHQCPVCHQATMAKTPYTGPAAYRGGPEPAMAAPPITTTTSA